MKRKLRPISCNANFYFIFLLVLLLYSIILSVKIWKQLFFSKKLAKLLTTNSYEKCICHRKMADIFMKKRKLLHCKNVHRAAPWRESNGSLFAHILHVRALCASKKIIWLSLGCLGLLGCLMCRQRLAVMLVYIPQRLKIILVFLKFAGLTVITLYLSLKQNTCDNSKADLWGDI